MTMLWVFVGKKKMSARFNEKEYMQDLGVKSFGEKNL
jgi:hypothetical protein